MACSLLRIHMSYRVYRWLQILMYLLEVVYLPACLVSAYFSLVFINGAGGYWFLIDRLIPYLFSFYALFVHILQFCIHFNRFRIMWWLEQLVRLPARLNTQFLVFICLGGLVSLFNIVVWPSAFLVHCSLLEEDSDPRMMFHFSRYGSDPAVKSWVDEVQVKFRCCGVYSRKDWLCVNGTEDGVPYSCCSTDATTPCFTAPPPPDSLYLDPPGGWEKSLWENPCGKAVREVFQWESEVILLLMLATTAVELVLTVGQRLLQSADAATAAAQDDRYTARILGVQPPAPPPPRPTPSTMFKYFYSSETGKVECEEFKDERLKAKYSYSRTRLRRRKPGRKMELLTRLVKYLVIQPESPPPDLFDRIYNQLVPRIKLLPRAMSHTNISLSSLMEPLED